MEDQIWLEVVIDTTAQELDGVCAKLMNNGMTGIVIEDWNDFQQFMKDNEAFWSDVDEELLNHMRDAARVKFYVTDDEIGKTQLAEYMDGIEQPYQISKLGENDWAHSWQKYYKPMSVGEKIYIVPEWEREKPIPDGKVVLYLNPGLTFGTGSHSSTRMCLMGLQEQDCENKTVLDLGSGSGILSIAALRLGAKSAFAIDIDPKTVNVAYENAGMNGIGKDTYLVKAGNVLEDEALIAEIAQKQYDIVLANIVADVIMPLAPKAYQYLVPGGVFLTSGIIDTREEEVKAAIEKTGLVIVSRREEKGWISFTAVKPKE